MKSYPKPSGHVAGPLLIFGSVSLVLGFAVEFLGIFAGAEQSLQERWKSTEMVFRGSLGAASPVGLLFGAAVSYGLVGAILGTPGIGRRMILGFSALVLGLALMPVLAVWGIFWKPFGLSFMILWAWFSAMIYASRHAMPCEGWIATDAPNVISLNGELSGEEKHEQANG